MRFRKRDSSEDKIYKQTYMRGKLEIVITPLWNVDGLGHNTIREDCRTWHMKYRTDGWVILERDIPHDLYSILTDLALALDEEVAKIIYEEMERHFNDLLCYVQRDGVLTAGWDLLVANVTQVRFPSVENFRAELSMIRWLNPNQRITTTTSAVTRNDAFARNIPDTFSSSNNDFRNNMYRRNTVDGINTVGYYDSPRVSGDIPHDYTRVLTAEEYEELRQNGELNSWEIYLVLN